MGGMGLGGLAKVAGVVTFVKAAKQKKRIQNSEGKESYQQGKEITTAKGTLRLILVAFFL